MTRLVALAFCLVTVDSLTAGAPMTEQQPQPRARILVHVASGPENATRAALAFLVARTAVEEGHAVTMFLAGDAVQLIRDEMLDSINGAGTGSLREHYATIVKKGGRFYLSGMSSKARGVGAADLADKPAEFAAPAVLVRLAVEHDRVFTY